MVIGGHWGLQAFGDLTLLTGVRGLVNPNSTYARLMDSAITPSRASVSLPSRQIGAVGFNAQTAEKVAQYKQQSKLIAEQNGWIKDNTLSKINGRDVYKSADGKTYYALDTRHGNWEVLNKRGQHQGVQKFDGSSIPNSKDTSGHHDLKVK